MSFPGIGDQFAQRGHAPLHVPYEVAGSLVRLHAGERVSRVARLIALAEASLSRRGRADVSPDPPAHATLTSALCAVPAEFFIKGPVQPVHLIEQVSGFRVSRGFPCGLHPVRCFPFKAFGVAFDRLDQRRIHGPKVSDTRRADDGPLSVGLVMDREQIAQSLVTARALSARAANAEIDTRNSDELTEIEVHSSTPIPLPYELRLTRNDLPVFTK